MSLLYPVVRSVRPTVNHTARDPFWMARELFGFPTAAPVRATGFAPAFEVKDTQDAYILTADLPGVAEDDLEISVHANVLTVSGSRTAEAHKDGEAYAFSERSFGSFSRSFALPELANPEQITAKLIHGVLTLAIGKKVEAKPRKIAVTREQ